MKYLYGCENVVDKDHWTFGPVRRRNDTYRVSMEHFESLTAPFSIVCEHEPTFVGHQYQCGKCGSPMRATGWEVVG